MNKAFVSTILNLNRAKLTHTAKAIFLELVCVSSPQNPRVLIDVNELAIALGKSVSTIKKAVKELLRLGLIVFDNIIVQLKHKIYRLIFNGGVEVKAPEKKAATRRAKPNNDVPVSASAHDTSKPSEVAKPKAAAPEGPPATDERFDKSYYPPSKEPGLKVPYCEYSVHPGRLEEAEATGRLLISLGVTVPCVHELYATKGFTRTRQLVMDFARFKHIYGIPPDIDRWFLTEGASG